MTNLYHSAAVHLARSITQQPEQWQPCRPDDFCYLRHVESGIEVWFYGGSAHLYRPTKVKFGWGDWWRLRRAYRAWRRQRGNRVAAETADASLRHVISTLA